MHVTAFNFWQSVLHIFEVCKNIVKDTSGPAQVKTKLQVLWWEEEYVAAFHCASGLLECANAGPVERPESQETDRGCGGIAVTKTSEPTEFVNLVTDSSSQLLEHLHTLSQEALDHADLTVLTGTLGAAALIKNCLWCYNEKLKNKDRMKTKQNAV